MALVAAAVLLSECDAPDSRQFLAVFVLPALAAGSFGAAGWLWPVDATTGQRLAVALFCGALLGAIGWFVVAASWAGRCSR